MEELSMDGGRSRGIRAAIAAGACALALLRAAAGHAAIAVDSTSSTSGKNITTLTWSHTVGAGSSRILVVGVSNQNTTRPVTGITYGGTALTRVGFQNAPGTQNRMELWSLTAPSPGTANVVVTFSGLVEAVGGSVSFTGVNKTTPHGTFQTAIGSTESTSDTFSCVSSQLVIVNLA